MAVVSAWRSVYVSALKSLKQETQHALLSVTLLSISLYFCFIVWKECAHIEFQLKEMLRLYSVMMWWQVNTEQGRSNMNSSHLPWHSLTTVFSSTEEAISMKSLQAYYWQQDQKDRKTPLAPPPQWHSEDKLTERETEACALLMHSLTLTRQAKGDLDVSAKKKLFDFIDWTS